MAKICGNTRHVAGTQCLNACIFHGVKRSASNDFGWTQCRMARGIMVLELQGETIGKATCFGHLLWRQQPAGHGHFKIFARLRRRVGGERKFNLRLMRECAGRAGQDLFELFKWRFVRHQSATRLHAAAMSAFVGLTGARSVKTCACAVATRSSVVRAPLTTAAKSLHTARLRK